MSSDPKTAESHNTDSLGAISAGAALHPSEPPSDCVVGKFAAFPAHFSQQSALRRTLYRGNRTYIELLSLTSPTEQTSEVSLPRRWINKALLRFSDVTPERVALLQEAALQHAAAGVGIPPIYCAQLTQFTTLQPRQLNECNTFHRAYLPHPTLGYLAQQPHGAALLRESAQSATYQLAHILRRLHRMPLHQKLLDCLFTITEDVDSAPILANSHPGLIHRDLTPNNLYLSDEGEVWLNDFGLARLVAQSPLPDDELLQGSRRFLPPELKNGQQPSRASDVYQWGLLFAWMLGPEDTTPEHTPEFRGDDWHAWAKERLRAYGCDDCLEKAPELRPSFDEVCTRLTPSYGR